MSDIKVDRALRGTPEQLATLTASIKSGGVRTPLLIRPSDYVVISGRRRLEACRNLGLRTAIALFPEDVLEACDELKKHLDDPHRTHVVPMSTRERIQMAATLHGLPKPADSKEKFAYDVHTGPAVGLTQPILWRARSIMWKAEPEGGASAEQALVAREFLTRISELIEEPSNVRSAGQAVREIHSEFLIKWTDLGGPVTVTPTQRPNLQRARAEGATADARVAICPHPDSPSERGSIPRIQKDALRRGVDAISGACAGLTSIDISTVSDGEAGYAERELPKVVRMVRQKIRELKLREEEK